MHDGYSSRVGHKFAHKVLSNNVIQQPNFGTTGWCDNRPQVFHLKDQVPSLLEPSYPAIKKKKTAGASGLWEAFSNHQFFPVAANPKSTNLEFPTTFFAILISESRL